MFQYTSMFVKVDNYWLNYAIYNKTGGKVALFIHGFLSNSNNEAAHNLYQLLASKDYKVYGIDLIGHGYSTGQRGFCDVTKQVEIVHKFIVDVVQCDKLTLIGQSMGGLICCKLGQLYPTIVEKIVSISPLLRSLHFDYPYSVLLLLSYVSKIFPKQIVVDVVDESTIVTHTNVEKNVRANIDCSITPKLVPLRYLICLPLNANIVLKTPIRVPTTIFHGEYDKITCSQASRKFAEKNVNCEFIEIPNAGHNLFYENDEIYNDFMDKLSQHL